MPHRDEGIRGLVNHLLPKHRQHLEEAAISPSLLAGVRSINTPEELPPCLAQYGNKVPGVLFRWESFEGELLLQLKADEIHKKEEERGGGGYRFPTGSTLILAVPPGHQHKVANPDLPLVIVEGGKQLLAAASALVGVDSYALVGMFGCWGWRSDEKPIPCLRRIPLSRRKVVLLLDGDVSTNRNVWDAAKAFQEHLETVAGVAEVRHVIQPANDNDGLDDLLGPEPPENRKDIVLRLLDKAKPTLPRKPPAKKKHGPAAVFFTWDGKFLPLSLWQFLNDQQHMAVTREADPNKASAGAIAVYDNGVYLNGASRRFNLSITRALGDEFFRQALENVTEIGLNELTAAARVIPDNQERLLVNCRNGLVDVMTGELLPHTPEFLSLWQLPVDYDHTAACPHYEQWIEERLPGQVAHLEEVASQALDPTHAPQRFLFLFGPKRSGKSTFLRILVALVGKRNTSAVTLHQLADDRFASANLYGKVLNVAADLSAKDVRDLSQLKMLTGEDLVQANRKYGAQFTFTNQALLAFSANEVPTVNDPSGAYQERAKPFHFAHSFAGHEDRQIEEQLLQELPGILNRFIRALQSYYERGGYLEECTATRDEFKRQSNRVQQFLDEMTEPTVRPQGTKRSTLWNQWKIWASDNSYALGGRNLFMEKVRGCGVEEFTPRGGSKSFLVRLIDPECLGPEGSDPNPLADHTDVGSGHGTGSVSCSEVTVADRVGILGAVLEASAGEAVGSFEGVSAVSAYPPLRALSSKKSASEPLESGLSKNADRRSKLPTSSRGKGSGASQVVPNDAGDMAQLTLAPGLSTPEPWQTRLWNTGEALPSESDLGPLPADQLAITGATDALVLDLETHSADRLWCAPIGSSAFIRLVGSDHGMSTSADSLRHHAGPLVMHNGIGFDALALAHHHDLDLFALGDAGLLIDTMVLESLAHPNREDLQPHQYRRQLGLDATAIRYGVPGKTNDLKALAITYGKAAGYKGKAAEIEGYGLIPRNLPAYQDYLRGDVAATRAIVERQCPDGRLTPYQDRELRICSRLAYGITLVGFRIDRPEVERRASAAQVVIEGGLARLEAIGLPPREMKKDGSWSSPHATKIGKAAIAAAFASYGINLRLTATSQPSIKKELMAELEEEHADRPEVVDLCRTVAALVGTRTVMQSILDYSTADRVHPEVFPLQATGRFSITNPGLTVLGKHAGKVAERAVFLPDADEHVLLALDLSKADARAVAAWSQDEMYLDWFEAGVDINQELADQFGISKQMAKGLGHGTRYNQQANGMHHQTGIPLEQCEAFLEQHRRNHPGVHRWLRAVVAHAKEGKPLQNGFGRLLFTGAFGKGHPRCGESKAFTQAPAWIGQSTTREWMVEGVLNLRPEVARCIRAFLHDEIVLSIHKGQLDLYREDLQRCFNFQWAPPVKDLLIHVSGATRPVQVVAEFSVSGCNWAECYTGEQH